MAFSVEGAKDVPELNKLLAFLTPDDLQNVVTMSLEQATLHFWLLRDVRPKVLTLGSGSHDVLVLLELVEFIE